MTRPLFVRYDVGNGTPLVLLHGINGDGTQWEKIKSLLEPHHRVIVVDLLGHGRSPRSKKAQYTPQEHADALRLTLENLGATKNLTVVGYSMGGTVAVSYAALYPKDITQLYLISAPFYLTPDQMISNRYAASLVITKSTQAGFGIMANILEKSPRVRKLVTKLSVSKKFREMIGAYDNILDADVVRKNLQQMIRGFDFAGMLSKVQAPVTYFAGKKDPVVVQGQLYALRQYSPYMDIERLSVIKMDHMLVQNLPKEIASLLLTHEETKLNIVVHKGTGPTLVLLHGIESSSHYWEPIVPALSERWRVVTVDLLGFGNSPKPTNIAYSLDDQVEWLHRTLQSKRITKFTFAAHSLGSLVALAYAAKYPKNIQAAYLFSPVLLPVHATSRRVLWKGLRAAELYPDLSSLYAQTASAIGDNRLSRFVPTIRSITNSVDAFEWVDTKAALQDIPITLSYGTDDYLVDPVAMKQFAKEMPKAKLKPSKDNHNFPFFRPKTALRVIDGKVKYTHDAKKGDTLSRTFVKQFVSLAAPLMFFKSTLYAVLGVLLFTDLAPYTLIAIVVGYVLFYGYQTIRGAFSLKNEGLSYFFYVLLSIASVIAAVMLFRRPEESLRIAIIALCVLFIGTGIMRIFVALRWAHTKQIRRNLFLSGLAMFVLGATALAGSIVSVYLIVYCIAAIMFVQGIRYAILGVSTLGFAYIRGFNRS
ncbi:MAG: alpha/beta fold hydrolase [Candidatus Microsaccharimonas sp.]